MCWSHSDSGETREKSREEGRRKESGGGGQDFKTFLVWRAETILEDMGVEDGEGNVPYFGDSCLHCWIYQACCVSVF